jgi:hypothetical protein
MEMQDCNWIFDLQPDEDIATFLFSGKNGSSIFSDSLTFEDFRVSALTRNVQLVSMDSSRRGVIAHVGLYTVSGEDVIALFNYKVDIDTVTVSFKRKSRDIKTVKYNGIIMESLPGATLSFQVYK